jgi:hypothetical protein
MATVLDILRGVGWPIAQSLAAEQSLNEVESRIGQRLPRTFRDLWGLDGGWSFLSRYSNSDWPLAPEKLALPTSRWPGYDPIEEGLLPFMIENQGVGAWAISLSGPEDPGVFVEVDSGTPPTWTKLCCSFTKWLECQVYDAQVLEDAWYWADGPEVGDSLLSLLRAQFDEVQETSGWPGKPNRRFQNNMSRLLIWSSGNRSDWHIAPRSADAALAAIDQLHRISGIGSALEVVNREEAEETLRIWRSANR